jgi:dipeptidyl aminopeptidase/acylaminoacyl peptidase
MVNGRSSSRFSEGGALAKLFGCFKSVGRWSLSMTMLDNPAPRRSYDLEWPAARGAMAAVALGILSVSACSPAPAPETAPTVTPPAPISRSALFADPAFARPSISPDGSMVAFLAPHQGYLNIWVAPVGSPQEGRPVTAETSRGLRGFAWSGDGASLLYSQDDRGDENWRIYVVSSAGGEPRAVTPAGYRAELISAAAADPAHILVTINDRDRSWPDVYRVALATGERTLVERNTQQYSGWLADRQNRLRAALRTTETGAQEIFVRDSRSRDGAGRWRKLGDIAVEDVAMTRLIGYSADGTHIVLIDSHRRDKAALVRMDSVTGERSVLAESSAADVVDVWLDPETFTAEAFAVEYLRREWRGLSPEAESRLAALDSVFEGEVAVVSRSRDDTLWIVEETSPTRPTRSALFSPVTGTSTPLFSHFPQLADQSLQPMIAREIPASDGLSLVSYLTLPPGSDADGDGLPERPAPLVLLVHGGPWARDSFGFDPRHQWLANRGYAVLSVNFRGSTGFGKAFLNAGNGEWGRRMQQDLSEAVAWAVGEQIADPLRVAIMGSSYGGYAALAGLAFTPDTFACGVSLVGPSNLTSLLNAIPPYWAAYRQELYTRIGDPRTPEGRQALRERSPLFAVDAMRAPLLVGQGARDVRVPRGESDQIVAALAARRVPVTYLLFPNEGHGLAQPQNRLAWYSAVEGFFGQCLGGVVEPVGDSFQGAEVYAVRGGGLIPGLANVARRPSAGVAPAP